MVALQVEPGHYTGCYSVFQTFRQLCVFTIYLINIYFSLQNGRRGIILQTTAIGYLLYSIQTWASLNQRHNIKGNHPFQNTLLLKLWISQRCIGGLNMLQSVQRWKCCTCMQVSKYVVGPLNIKSWRLPSYPSVIWICRLPKRLKNTIVWKSKSLCYIPVSFTKRIFSDSLPHIE